MEREARVSDKLESNSTACRGERKHFTPNIITDKRRGHFSTHTTDINYTEAEGERARIDWRSATAADRRPRTRPRGAAYWPFKEFPARDLRRRLIKRVSLGVSEKDRRASASGAGSSAPAVR
jgi:hypothetical protein